MFARLCMHLWFSRLCAQVALHFARLMYNVHVVMPGMVSLSLGLVANIVDSV